MRSFFFCLLLSLFLNANEIEIKTISSNFTQSVTSPEGDSLNYEGSFYALNENIALWIYDQPVEKKIYFFKNSVIIIEPDLEQAIQTSIEEVPDIASILQAAIVSKKEVYEVIILEIKYSVNFKNEVPVSIKYIDKLENKNEIKLEDVKFNEIFEESIFKINVPSHYDIINY